MEKLPKDQKNKTKKESFLKDKDQRKAIMKVEKDDLLKQLQIYVVPVLIIVLFFSILMFVVRPTIKKTFETIELRSQAKVELSEKKVELKELEDLVDTRDRNSKLLDKLEELIPTKKTKVEEFVRRVREFAQFSGIEITDVIAGERSLLESDNAKKKNNEAEDQEKAQLQLMQIPMEFELTGPLANFQDMLVAIYESSDFIIISDMELENNPESDGHMEIMLSKYQFLPFDTFERSILNSVSTKEQPDDLVVEFIQRKSNVDVVVD